MFAFIIFNPVVNKVILFLTAILLTPILGEEIKRMKRYSSPPENLKETYNSKITKHEITEHERLFFITILIILIIFGNVFCVLLRENISKKMIKDRYDHYRKDMINAVNSKDISVVSQNFKDTQCQIYKNTKDYIAKLNEGKILDCYEEDKSHYLQDYIFTDNNNFCTAKGYEETSVEHFDSDGNYIESIECSEAYEYTFELINYRNWLLIKQETIYQK